MPATAVLVHGAYHGAWCWERVAAELERAGIVPLAVDLPFTSLADDVAIVRRALDHTTGPAVVCAHSYGALVSTLATSGASAVGALVYVAGFMVDVRTVAGARVLTSAGEGWDPTQWSPAEVIERLYHDCDEDDAAAAVARLRPTPRRSLAELAEAAVPPAFEQVESTYVVCTLDRALSPDAQEAMAERATHVRRLDTGHAPFLAAPAALAAVVLEAAARLDV